MTSMWQWLMVMVAVVVVSGWMYPLVHANPALLVVKNGTMYGGCAPFAYKFLTFNLTVQQGTPTAFYLVSIPVYKDAVNRTSTPGVKSAFAVQYDASNSCRATPGKALSGCSKGSAAKPNAIAVPNERKCFLVDNTQSPITTNALLDFTFTGLSVNSTPSAPNSTSTANNTNPNDDDATSNVSHGNDVRDQSPVPTIPFISSSDVSSSTATTTTPSPVYASLSSITSMVLSSGLLLGLVWM